MIVVDGVDNVFLAVLDDLPDGTSDHVTSGNWGDAQTFALAFEQHSLYNVKKVVKNKYYETLWSTLIYC
jgi:hypothetical protein